ncbi:hypothetical protein [Lysobacter sp. D1-1-M9]|uniref:hypothetical protein n=1 Tax=Novilysobacter longmucuonensis TaxID=3098603 RepID=UPI002FC961E4
MSAPDRNTPDRNSSDTNERPIPSDVQGGREASGKHHGLRQPHDEQRIDQALDDVGLVDQGAAIEDDLRDRRSNGTPSGRGERTERDRADERR